MLYDILARRLLTAAFTAAALLAGTARADVVLPTGLTPGTEYQIAFVTAYTIDARSGVESTYNTFVASEANRSPTLASLGATWTSITSTRDGTDACNNAPQYAGVPIYDTQGQLLSADGALYMHQRAEWPYGWAGGLDRSIKADQFGESVADGIWVWTGSQPDGRCAMPPDSLPLGAYQMGDTTNYQAMFGMPGLSDPYYWFAAGHDNLDYYGTISYHPVYALSSRITVAPEPGTLLLLGLGGVLLRRRQPCG